MDITAMHWLPADPALRLAAQSALALAAVTLAVLVQVLVLSAVAARQRRHRDAFNAAWRPALAVAGLDDDALDAAALAALPPPVRGRRTWWLMQWNRMQRQVRGASSQRLNRVLHRLDLEPQVRRLLRARSVRARLVALEAARHLSDPGHWHAIEPQLQARNPFVALAAAHALVAIDPTRAMQLVMPLAVSRVDWGVPRIAALCQQAGREAVTPPLLDALEAADAAGLDRLVPLLRHADPRRAAPWARDCLARDPEPRHRAGAVQTLGQLHDPRDRDALVQALDDEDAAVRLVAVESLRARLGPDDAALLVPRLSDRSWWVRRAAADTLVELPRIDDATLETWANQVEDRYGREALQRALDERRGRNAATATEGPTS
ncbi:HEAT repeat domain-containing protein [Cognatilysobacter bugurensis]|uniref:HEAT repeat domain-containing protein n=1 Tax=Cognatilysobacter bugurensis TaxID=543356 RepID=A0A918WA22_9GAMM|nr:HEAT repeat domain-containing protein [Lysobacter bugurensis]GHA87549.1 hypothetical protein GCM10007067_26900 [Lysobacter bugurensis]